MVWGIAQCANHFNGILVFIFSEAIEELKALQLHLVEKSDKIEGLTQHVKQLQYEVEQQTSLVCPR